MRSKVYENVFIVLQLYALLSGYIAHGLNNYVLTKEVASSFMTSQHSHVDRKGGPCGRHNQEVDSCIVYGLDGIDEGLYKRMPDTKKIIRELEEPTSFQAIPEMIEEAVSPWSSVYRYQKKTVSGRKSRHGVRPTGILWHKLTRYAPPPPPPPPPCSSSPCKNGGACANTGSGFSCSCTGGWTGSTCSQDIDECQSSPCQNGAACKDEANSYSCNCSSGWTGTNCETDIDECQSSPCQNGAGCKDGANSYSCNCSLGWTGTNCETDIEECQSSPCQNGAECKDEANSYSCNCSSGWTGTNCETDIDECQSSPCQNGARCKDGANSYSCNCSSGWTGTNCETDIDECQSSPCQNGAACKDEANSYSCNCSSGWTGTNCETDIDECQSSPCQNGARCKDGANSYSCNCSSGWTGTNCETDIDECQSSPCQNGAACKDGANSYSCNCSSGWTGTNCEKDIDECQSSPCQNGARCKDGANSYSCNCSSGWTGTNCETDIEECQSSPCQNGAACKDGANSYSCNCSSGWTGTNCETDMCAPANSKGADIVFVVDSSLSVGAIIFEQQIEYIRNFVRNFTIGPTNFQVAVVSYSFRSFIHCYLNTHDNETTLLAEIDQMTLRNGPSFTDRALKSIHETVLTSANGMRSSVPKYVIVFTDGLSSNIVETTAQAKLLKYTGAEVLTVAFGSQICHTELLDIAGHSMGIFPSTLPDALYSVLKQNMQDCPDCTRNTSDVIILFDSSMDLAPSEYYPAIDGLKTLVSGMPIGLNKVHVSYVKYAQGIHEEFDFTQYQTRDNVISQITTRLVQYFGPANLSKAFDHVINNGFGAWKGARENARKFVVAFTQGRFDDFEIVKNYAETLKNAGVILAAVGTGNSANMTTLLDIASEPAFAFVIGDEVNIKYNVLLSLTSSFEFDVCEFD